MGYSTDFFGRISLNKTLDKETAEFLIAFAESRRVAWKGLDPKYGIDGEYYTEGGSDPDRGPNLPDYNKSPRTQPGLWCNWVPTDDLMGIEWNGGEKFYDATEWMGYIVNKILAPKGYICNGTIEAQGENTEDRWYLKVTDNEVISYDLDHILQRLEIYECPIEDLPLLTEKYDSFNDTNKKLYNSLLAKAGK
jgi:hypothetical protein